MLRLALALLFGIYGSIAYATPYLVFADQVSSTACQQQLSDGSNWLTVCPDYLEVVTCSCEHSGSPYSDFCEVIPQGNIFRYAFSPIGRASVSQVGPTSPYASFSCPQGFPPSSANCTAQVLVTNTFSGVTKSAVCHGH